MKTFTDKKFTDIIFCGRIEITMLVKCLLSNSFMKVIDINLLSGEQFVPTKEPRVLSILNSATQEKF